MSDRMPYKMSESERTEYIYIHYSIRMSNRMLNKLWERVSEYVSVGGGNILYVLVYVCICMYMYIYALNLISKDWCLYTSRIGCNAAELEICWSKECGIQTMPRSLDRYSSQPGSGTRRECRNDSE